jgi:hypothetical protein
MIDTRSGETVLIAISPTIPASQTRAICCAKHTSGSLQMGITPILVSVDAFISEASVAQFETCKGRLSQPRLLLQVVTCAMCDPDAIRNNILRHIDVPPLTLLVSCNRGLCERTVHATLSSFFSRISQKR